MDKLHEVLPKSERTVKPAQSTPAVDVLTNGDQPVPNGSQNNNQPKNIKILTGMLPSFNNKVGSAEYGATFVLGDLDSLGRATWCSWSE